MEESWSRPIEIEGVSYEIMFFRRPFREGLEVEFELDGTVVHWAELGYGENTVIEKVKSYITSKGIPTT